MPDNLDELRHIEGFPLGENDDLRALSDPPYYTAYPNPHITEFIEKWGKPYDEATDDYHREPYVEDEAFGRTDDVYNCHSYHTKVPPQAIQKYLQHYTERNHVVLDVFAGTGMTGVAAQREERRAVLIDLAPIATFIAANNCTDVPSGQLHALVLSILHDVGAQYGYFYETRHSDGRRGVIKYTIWSDIVECPYCHGQRRYWDMFLLTPERIRNKKRNQTYIRCECNAEVESGDLVFVLDSMGKKTQAPVRICYLVGTRQYTKTPDSQDLALVDDIKKMTIAHWYPDDLYMFKGNKWGDLWRGYHVGIETVADFYMKRNLIVLGALHERIRFVSDKVLRGKLLYILTATLPRVNRLNRYMPEHNRHVGPLSGTLYISKLPVEINVLQNFGAKAEQISRARFHGQRTVIVSTQSAADLSNIDDDSIDYIFTDPPFGENLPYAELNFISEAWLRVFTQVSSETIVSNTQSKDLDVYREMVLSAFRECYRVLKPNRWITVEFHNSKASVWSAIQDSLSRAGFVVAQVVVLDKEKGTTKQLSYPGTVAKDLIINAYKPRAGFARSFLSRAGRGLEAEFIRQHLAQLPLAANVERSREMLYSKYLAYYVQHGYQVAYNGEQFYRALPQWGMEERDGYWFADEVQANEYEKRKARVHGRTPQAQAVLFISDEHSARQWLWGFLDTPKTYADIYNAFVKALQTSEDQLPEPMTMLEEGFVRTNGYWKRPDTLTQAELDTRRQARLLRQFEEYLATARAGGRLKEVRREALVAGFTEAYRGGRFADILAVGRRLDKRLLESSPDLFDFVDIAEAKVEG